MSTKFSLRQLSPEDGQILGELMEKSPDTGKVGSSSHFEVDAFETFSVTQNNFTGVVAESPDYNGLIGACMVRFGKSQFDGELRPSALLNSLVVHPKFRRQGVASAMIKWLIDYTHNHLGEKGVIWALIQQGNIGSVRTLTKYLKQFINDRIIVIPIKTRSNPPKTSRFTVRSAESDDFGQIADKLNNFYRNFEFYEPETAETLASWCSRTPFDTPFHHYLIAEKDGEIHAGIGVSEEYRLKTLHITSMPFILRLLNVCFRIVPKNGVSKDLTLSKVWFDPGYLHAARYLLETIRWQWREQATMILALIDRKTPVSQVFNLKPWSPVTKSAVIIDTPLTNPEERLFYYE